MGFKSEQPHLIEDLIRGIPAVHRLYDRPAAAQIRVGVSVGGLPAGVCFRVSSETLPSIDDVLPGSRAGASRDTGNIVSPSIYSLCAFLYGRPIGILYGSCRM